MTQDLTARLEAQLAEVRDLGDEARALSARQLLPGSTRLVLSQLPASVSLAEAAARIAEAYNLLHGGVFNRVTRRGGELRFCVDERGFPFAVKDEEAVQRVMEETLFFTHACLSVVLPEAARSGLLGVSLRRPRGEPAVPFARWAPIRRGANAYQLRYAAAQADEAAERPPRERLTYEAVVREQIRLLSAGGSGESLAAKIRTLLEEGVTEQEDAAARLGLSAPTLRRRLASEGVSFRTLRLAHVAARADALLASSLALTDIAGQLGFSDVRSFNRAYKAQRGITPAGARRGGLVG
jgi:AraC-like DNA-binding protein